MGIPPENLTRIFAHGFTTRKDGHGFGLHSGALAAWEMGGQLAVHSLGLGQGATFTLELPLGTPPASPASPVDPLLPAVQRPSSSDIERIMKRPFIDFRISAVALRLHGGVGLNVLCDVPI